MTALQSQNMQENETKCFVPDVLIMCTGLLFNQLKVKQRLVFFREICKKFPALAGHSRLLSIPWINGRRRFSSRTRKPQPLRLHSSTCPLTSQDSLPRPTSIIFPLLHDPLPWQNLADLNGTICYPHISCALFPLKSAWFYLLASFHTSPFKVPYITDQICAFIILILMSEATLPFETLERTNKTTWCHNQQDHDLNGGNVINKPLSQMFTESNILCTKAPCFTWKMLKPTLG